MGVCIQTGHIVWINGPFRAGLDDLSIARQAVVRVVERGEKVEADGGYEGKPHYISTPADAVTGKQAKMKSSARHPHEHGNSCLKIFKILEKPFRNDLEKHSLVFRAVAVITQLNIEIGFDLWEVEYGDELTGLQSSH